MRLTHKNYATESWMHDFARDMVPLLVHETRRERTVLNDRWMHFHKMHQVEIDQPSYMGRSQVYFAAARRAVETWVTALMEALFPQTDWFKVLARHGVGDPKQVPRWSALQRHYLDQMELEDQFPMFLRDFGTFGNAFLRHTWDVQTEPQRVWERQLKRASLDHEASERRIREEEDPDSDDLEMKRNGTVFRLIEKEVTTYAGPIVRPVSPFHMYVAPITARNLTTATAVFEDLEVPFAHVETMHERWMDPEQPEWGRIYDHPDWDQIVAAKGILTDEMLQYDTERWARINLDPNTNRVHTALSKKGNTQLTELFWRGEIKGGVDETGRAFGIRDWHFVLLNDCFVVRAHPNLTYGNIRPWLDARMYRTNGCYYAQGIMDSVASPQLMMNDIGNLTIDNLVMALSPPVAIDQNMVVDPESLEWAPGAKWFGDGPPGQWVQPLTIPTQAQLGMSMLGLMSGLVQDQSGANFAVQAVTPPRGKGRAGQTAAGMSQYLGQGSQEILGFAKSIERQALEKMLTRNYQFTEQFGADKVIIQRLGIDGVALITEEVGVEDIIGTYAYQWRGATSVRERGMLLGTLQQLPQMLVSLAQFDPSLPQGFDVKEYLRLMLVDVANIPWAEQLFKMPLQGASVDPHLEEEAFELHRKAEPFPGDDDAMHMQSHIKALETDDAFKRDPIARQFLTAHLDATVQQIMAKQQAQQQAMMQQQMAMMQGPQGPPQGPPGQGSPPAGPPEAGPPMGPPGMPGPPGPPQMMQ